MTTADRDPGLDTLLDLHGQTLFVDEAGNWVKFVAVRTEVTAQRPHGLSYSLTLHAPDGARLVGFDNAHAVRERRGPGTRRRRRERSSSPAAHNPGLRLPGCRHAPRGFLDGG